MFSEIIPYVVTAISLVAALSLFLQARRMRKSGSDRDVSHAWYILLGVNNAAWLLYGWEIGSLPLVLTSSVGLIGVTSIALVDFGIHRRR